MRRILPDRQYGVRDEVGEGDLVALAYAGSAQAMEEVIDEAFESWLMKHVCFSFYC